MSPHIRRTSILAGALALLVAADLAVHWRASAPPADLLPSIEKVDPGIAAVVRLEKGDDELVLERDGVEAWKVSAPFEYPADRALVVNALQALRKGVPMDVRVDEGNLELYGLASPESIRVTIEDETDVVMADFYVGLNAAGGSSFVRFPESDEVYRARVGGRQRYDRSASEWRDHMVLGFSADLVESIGIERADGRLHFVRGSDLDERGRPAMGAWSLEDQPDFPLDQKAVSELAETLVSTRAGEILSPEHPAGLERPAATLVLTVITGDTYVIQLGMTPDGAFAQKEGQPEVLRISPSIIAKAIAPLSAWRDRELMRFDRPAVHQMILVEPGFTTVLEQDPATSSWTITKPANVAADLRQAMFNARTLGALRAEAIVEVSPADAGFPSGERIEVILLEGGRQVVEIGGPVPGRQAGMEARFVRTPDQPERIGVLPAKTISQLRKAWSR